MPFYEYQCNACSHRLEALQKISDAPLLRCPVCGAESLQKLISKAAFRLKGAGWYETDFKNSGAKAEQSKKESDSKDDAPRKHQSVKPAGDQSNAAGEQKSPSSKTPAVAGESLPGKA